MRLGALRNSDVWLDWDLPTVEYKAKTPDDLMKAMRKVMEVAKVHRRCQHKHQSEALADTLAGWTCHRAFLSTPRVSSTPHDTECAKSKIIKWEFIAKTTVTQGVVWYLSPCPNFARKKT